MLYHRPVALFIKAMSSASNFHQQPIIEDVLAQIVPFLAMEGPAHTMCDPKPGCTPLLTTLALIICILFHTRRHTAHRAVYERYQIAVECEDRYIANDVRGKRVPAARARLQTWTHVFRERPSQRKPLALGFSRLSHVFDLMI